MTEEEEDLDESSPRERSSAPIGLAVTVLFCGLAVGAFFFMTRKSDELSSQGLDIANAPVIETPPPVAAPPATPPSAQQGTGQTFGIAVGQAPVARPAAPASGDAKGRAEVSFAEAARRNEAYFRNLTIRYQNKYPVFLEWGKEWVSYPELKKARDDYFENHNPVRFAFQIASSPNLPKMISKYSGRPEMMKYLQDMATSAPKEVLTSFVGYLQKDGNATALCERFAAAAGLPPALVAGFTGKKVDQNAVMKQILQSNPGQQTPPQE